MKTRIALILLILVFNAFKELFDAPAYDQPIRILTFAGDVIMLALAVTAFGRNRGFYGQTMLYVFLGVSTFTLLYNLDRVGVLGHLNGIRESLFFLSSIVTVHDVLTSDEGGRFRRWFTVLLVIIAVAQIPTSLRQFLQYGPSDWVGGTLGWGATNVVVQLLFLIVFYLAVLYAYDPEREQFRVFRIGLLVLLLAPCAINETKISFIFLPVLMAAFIPTSRLYRLVPVVVLGSALMYFLIVFYSATEKDTSQVFDSRYLERYLFYDERQTVDVPRFQKLMLTADLMAEDPVTFAIGMGYGLFMGGNILDQSSVGRTLYFLRGARMFFNTIFLQGGMLAAICLAIALFQFLRSRAPVSFAMTRFKWFLAFVLFAMWFYHDSLLNRTYALIVSYLILWTEQGGIDTQAEGEEPGEEEVADHPSAGNTP